MNYCSNPTDLRITDMRFVDIDGAPKRCTILRIDTNQGISKVCPPDAKSRLIGKDPDAGTD